LLHLILLLCDAAAAKAHIGMFVDDILGAIAIAFASSSVVRAVWRKTATCISRRQS
jgi:hypothetical protein